MYLLDIYFGHLCMLPQQIWGNMLFEGPTRARYFESDDFARAAMLREKNLEHQADDELYIHIYAAAHAACQKAKQKKENSAQ